MRFVIIGTSGCGKSTFARRLAALTRSPHIELDALHWLENWTERPDAEFAAAVQHAAQGERWVADGNYNFVRNVLWPRATHIVWLNFSRPVVFSRVLRRTARRSLLRERLWHGNRESLLRALFSRDSILVWSWTTFASNRSKYAALRSGPEYPHLTWIEFTTPQQAEAHLTDLASGLRTNPAAAVVGDLACEPQ